MSDTLQERDEQNADWCDDCHGYTHMPWCPSYEPAVDDKELYVQPTTTTHQPAARGGGEGCLHSDKTWRVHRNGTDVACGHDYIAIATTKKHAAQIVTEHNQHQVLVAEREGLRESLADMIGIIEDEGHVSSYVPQVTAARKILAETALTNAANKQRSTSE